MKKIFMIILACTALIFLGIISCIDPSSNNVPEKDNFFYDSAKLTIPNISESSSRAITWANGYCPYEIYQTLREYIPDISTVGLENIYKLLYQAGGFYNMGLDTAKSIPEQVITLPFDFGNGITYDRAGNDMKWKHGYAIKEIDQKKYGIMSWEVNHGARELGVFEGVYDAATKDLTIDMAVFVDYASSNDYSLRSRIVGNSETHVFKLWVTKYNGAGYSISMVGAGVSRGAGNYFLFNITDSQGITDRYFSFPADATADTLKAMSVAGDATADANTAAYKPIVDSMTKFAGPADLPDESSDFNNGSITSPGLAKTIYINYTP
jgi:hypothetical protein